MWSQINKRPGKPINRLYVEYGISQFENLHASNDADPALLNFVEYIKKNGPRFSHFTEEQLEYFEERLYELGKNNPNNTTGQIV